jgi:hypothetical protein
MAVRFYKELDNLSTADFYTDEAKEKPKIVENILRLRGLSQEEPASVK